MQEKIREISEKLNRIINDTKGGIDYLGIEECTQAILDIAFDDGEIELPINLERDVIPKFGIIEIEREMNEFGKMDEFEKRISELGKINEFGKLNVLFERDYLEEVSVYGKDKSVWIGRAAIYVDCLSEKKKKIYIQDIVRRQIQNFPGLLNKKIEAEMFIRILIHYFDENYACDYKIQSLYENCTREDLVVSIAARFLRVPKKYFDTEIRKYIEKVDRIVFDDEIIEHIHSIFFIKTSEMIIRLEEWRMERMLLGEEKLL